MSSAVDVCLFSTICLGALVYHRLQWIFNLTTTTTNKATKALKLDEKNNNDDDGAVVKVVVISGCDRGLGRLMAETWSTRETGDYLVVALTLTQAAAMDLTNEKVPSLVAIQCNVTSDTDCLAMKRQVQQILQETPRAALYCIVNNAGIANPGDFVFYDSCKVPIHVMNVNYFGQLRVTQALLPFMLTTSQTVGGKIFNVSSVCGCASPAGNSAYNASKFAVEGWSDALALELEHFNVQVVKIRPGRFQTDIQTDFMENFIQNFQTAPDQIRNLYGNAAYTDVLKTASSTLSDGLATPKELVDLMTELLLQNDNNKLESSYFVGRDAKTLWRALTVLPTPVAKTIKFLLSFSPQGPPLPPTNTIAHVTIRVRSLELALPFYQALGFECVGGASVQHAQLLQYHATADKAKKWNTLLMLQQDKDMPMREKSSSAGYTGLCICCLSVEAMVETVENKGYRAMAPTAVDEQKKSHTKLAAFSDPDGFVVTFIEFGGIMGLVLRAQCWWNRRPPPFLFSVTVNVTDHVPIFPMFEHCLGMTTLGEQNTNQVAQNLLSALQMDPAATVIERIRYCVHPKGGIVACIMNWTTPPSKVDLASATNSITISVSNVQEALKTAQEVGMCVKDGGTPEYRTLPVYGTVLVGTAFLEEQSCPIEFCCFTNQKPS